MHRWIAAIVIASACSAPVLGGEPKGKLVTETWDAAYLEGGKAGTVHITTHEMERAGHKFFRRGAIEIEIGGPLVPSGTDWAAAVDLHGAARAWILSHCDEPDLP